MVSWQEGSDIKTTNDGNNKFYFFNKKFIFLIKILFLLISPLSIKFHYQFNKINKINKPNKPKFTSIKLILENKTNITPKYNTRIL